MMNAENLAVITLAVYPEHPRRHLRKMLRSCQRFGIQMEVACLCGEYSHLEHKLEFRADFVRSLDERVKYVLFVDGRDAFFTRSLKDIAEAFNNIGFEGVLVGAEKELFPCKEPSWRAKFPSMTSGRNFINSGVLLAERECFLDALETLINLRDTMATSELLDDVPYARAFTVSEQMLWQIAYLKGLVNIKLDDRCKIVLNLSKWDDERPVEANENFIFLEDDTLQVRDTGVSPAIIHVPASHREDIFNEWWARFFEKGRGKAHEIYLEPRIEKGASRDDWHAGNMEIRKMAVRKWYFDNCADAGDQRILFGPFRGMKYIDFSSGSEYLPKILGTYEMELHPWIAEILRTEYSKIVNIGAGEGFYAVGFAIFKQSISVDAFESNPLARSGLGALAELNGVARNVQIKGHCGPAELSESLCANSLIFCDIEGAEIELIDPAIVPQLRSCDLIIELHDGNEFVLASLLEQRFKDSHSAHLAVRTDRSCELHRAWMFPDEESQRIALDENRRVGLSWLFLRRRVDLSRGRSG